MMRIHCCTFSTGTRPSKHCWRPRARGACERLRTRSASLPDDLQSTVISHSALRERVLHDRATSGAVPRLAAALAAIGWNSVGDPTPDELADHLVELVDVCITDHRDPERLVSDISRL